MKRSVKESRVRSLWAWWIVAGFLSVAGVGCSSDPADPVDGGAGTHELQELCEAAGGDFHDRAPAMICAFGSRQGSEVGPGFSCPEGFPNRLGDAELLFCNATTDFPAQILVALDALYPTCTDCEQDVGDSETDTDRDTGEIDAGEELEGDSCASPLVLELVEGEVEVEGSTEFANADALSTCDANAQADQVYALTLDAPGDLVVEVEALSGTFVPAISLRTVCEQLASQLPGACARHRARPGKNAVIALSAEAATYYIWVGTPDVATGDYRLRASFSPREGTQPPDACAALPTVAMGDGQILGLSVSARGQFEVEGPLCEHQTSVRSQVGLQIATEGILTVDLLRGQSQGYAARFRPGCESAQEEQCGDIIIGEQRNTLMREDVQPGLATLSLGNLPNSAIPGFEMELRHSGEPAGESCLGPERLELGAPVDDVREATVQATLLDYSDRRDASCGVNGRDRVWELVLDEASDVFLEAESDSGAALSVSLVSGCEEAGLCASGELRRSGLAPGSYFVWVDGDLDDPALFELRARVSPALVGGSCALPGDAVALSAGQSTTLTLRAEDGPAELLSCAATNMRDRTLRLELLDQGDLALSTTPGAEDELLYAELAVACADAGTCGPLDDGFAGLAMGEYALKIASLLAAGEGDVDVLVELLNPGERCFGAEPLALNQSHDVSLSAYAPDGAPGCASEALAADRAFSFELSAPSTVIATLTPLDSGQSATLWLERRGCTDALELGCNVSDAGQPATLVLGALQAGTYRVWAGGNPGDYTLELTTN